MAEVFQPLHGLLGYCRQGFEPELAAEFTQRAAEAGVAGYAETQRGLGFVLFHVEETTPPDALPLSQLIFARQRLWVIARLREVDPGDRIRPVLDALAATTPARPFGELWVEHADSDAGRPLATLARSLGNAMRRNLRDAGWLTARDTAALPRLHVFLASGNELLLAIGDPANDAPWRLGIPRLRMHAEAPSRSALKLEEALLTLLTPQQRHALLRPGMRAADLGAAPGGWSWVLMRQGLYVTAVDNGPLKPALLESGLITHLREDGFRWHPVQPLDWMVCDMVEQPIRVAHRMAEWFARGWCRHAIFNLKLPMKKRWAETVLCLDAFGAAAGHVPTIRARQLHHDREEVTVFASTSTNPSPGQSGTL